MFSKVRIKRGNVFIASIITLAVLVFFVVSIHNFLAISRPVEAEILIVEGWLWDRPALDEAVQYYKEGHCRYILTVGTVVTEKESPIVGKSFADLAASRLHDYGIETGAIIPITFVEGASGRTVQSAQETLNWIKQEMPESTSINVMTLGVHARKSWIIFRKSFGLEYCVGIIAGTESSYKVTRWWTSRRGIYLVLRNTMGYLYALTL